MQQPHVVHVVLWILAAVLAVAGIFTAGFPALALAILCGAAAELFGG